MKTSHEQSTTRIFAYYAGQRLPGRLVLNKFVKIVLNGISGITPAGISEEIPYSFAKKIAEGLTKAFQENFPN